jgi:hypothetical protein
MVDTPHPGIAAILDDLADREAAVAIQGIAVNYNSAHG